MVHAFDKSDGYGMTYRVPYFKGRQKFLKGLDKETSDLYMEDSNKVNQKIVFLTDKVTSSILPYYEMTDSETNQEVVKPATKYERRTPKESYRMCGIKSIRIDLKKSQKAKKEIINSDIYEYEKLLCKSLSKKTGLELFFGDDSFLEYKKNETGEIISSKKSSKSARQDLMEAINAKDFIYNIFLKNNDEEIHGANSSHRNKEDFAGGMHIDIADIENINTKNSSYDIGMIFLHELNHGYFGLSDPTGDPEIKKTLWRTKFGGEDMHGLYSITK